LLELIADLVLRLQLAHVALALGDEGECRDILAAALEAYEPVTRGLQHADGGGS
jgi:hypothetical protein